MQGKLKQTRQRRQKQLRTRHVVYRFVYFSFSHSFSKTHLLFWGPLDPQTFGRKKLLLDFYFLLFLNFIRSRSILWVLRFVLVRRCPFYNDYTVSCVGKISTNSTWPFDCVATLPRNPLLKMSQKLKHQLRSKLLQMTCASAVLGCCRKTSVRSVDNACSCLKTCWNHDSTICEWLRSLREAEAECDWKSQMLSQMRQLQESARVIKSPRKSFYVRFFHDGAWLRSCIVIFLYSDLCVGWNRN